MSHEEMEMPDHVIKRLSEILSSEPKKKYEVVCSVDPSWREKKDALDKETNVLKNKARILEAKIDMFWAELKEHTKQLLIFSNSIRSW